MEMTKDFCMNLNAKSTIEAGKAVLGIEFGSTRIKAVLIDQENKPIAQGSHEWENQLVDGLWTYSVEAIWHGLQDCYAQLRADVNRQYETEIESLKASIDKLQKVNGNLLLQLPVMKEEKKEETPKKNYRNMRDNFDEFGNFKR